MVLSVNTGTCTALHNDLAAKVRARSQDPRQFTQMYEAESGQNWRPKNLTPDYIRTILPKVFG